MGMSLPVIIGALFYHVETSLESKSKKTPLFYIIGYYICTSLMVNLFPVSKNSFLWILIYILIFGAPFIYHGIQFIKHNTKQNQLNILFNTFILVLYATYISYSRATWIDNCNLGIIFTITILTKEKLSLKISNGFNNNIIINNVILPNVSF